MQDQVTSGWVEIEAFDTQINDMWTKYDTKSVSLATVASDKKYQKIQEEMDVIQVQID